MIRSANAPRTICFCNSNIPWGGGENWHLNAAASFAARGWRVLLLCHPGGTLFRRAAALPGVEAIALPLGRLSFLNPLLRLRLTRLFRRENVRVLIMNAPADLKAAAPAAAAAGVRHIIYRRGSALPVRDSFLNRRLYGRTITRLIVNSEATRAQALVNNPDLIPAERITVLPNGIDVRAFDAALEAARKAPPPLCLEAGQGAERPYVLGNAGRLNRQKGQHLLLHLLRRLLDAGLDCRLVIAGEGEREAELKALAANLGLGDRAVFPGFLPDLAPFWIGIDLFVLTSLWEGFGNVIIEAGLAAKPVFAFAVSNLPELIDCGPDGNGSLFPLPLEERAGSPEAERGQSGGAAAQEAAAEAREGRDSPRAYRELDGMVEAVLKLAADPEQASRMGRAGRRMAEDFSQETRMDALEALLE